MTVELQGWVVVGSGNTVDGRDGTHITGKWGLDHVMIEMSDDCKPEWEWDDPIQLDEVPVVIKLLAGVIHWTPRASPLYVPGDLYNSLSLPLPPPHLRLPRLSTHLTGGANPLTMILLALGQIFLIVSLPSTPNCSSRRFLSFLISIVFPGDEIQTILSSHSRKNARCPIGFMNLVSLDMYLEDKKIFIQW